MIYTPIVQSQPAGITIEASANDKASALAVSLEDRRDRPHTAQFLLVFGHLSATITSNSARDLGLIHRSSIPTCVQPSSNPAFRIRQPRPDRCRLDTVTEESTLVRSPMMSRAKEVKKAFRLIIRHRGCCTSRVLECELATSVERADTRSE